MMGAEAHFSGYIRIALAVTGTSSLNTDGACAFPFSLVPTSNTCQLIKKYMNRNVFKN